ncbi:hypothetical protein [Dactylosporangium salmoneum]|uniref:Uncharacterized protein n=1 Tax=Dactylosporangium salmoneum TaxID=53361 RepID=A0ABP5UWX4_9ACTN
MRVGRAVGCFFAAYAIVTVLAGTSTLVYAGVNHTEAADAAAVSPVLSPSFTATVPFHVLIMVLVFTPFAALYWRKGARADRVRETLLLSVLWIVSAMVVDFVGFVLIKNPWSLTPHQFYVDYQPWITLIYAAIFASPWLWLGITSVRRANYGSSAISPRV